MCTIESCLQSTRENSTREMGRQKNEENEKEGEILMHNEHEQEQPTLVYISNMFIRYELMCKEQDSKIFGK